MTSTNPYEKVDRLIAVLPPDRQIAILKDALNRAVGSLDAAGIKPDEMMAQFVKLSRDHLAGIIRHPEPDAANQTGIALVPLRIDCKREPLLPVLKLEIEGTLYHLIGGNSDEMIESVKRIPGSQWGEYLSKGNLWVLPGTIAEVRAALPTFQALQPGEELIQAEAFMIEAARAEVTRRKSELSALLDRLLADVSSYSPNSRSRYRAEAFKNADCLFNTFQAIKKPLEDLKPLEALSIVKAIRLTP